MNLLRVSKDLAQRRGVPLRHAAISLSEVQLHNQPHDGWMILRNKVYNITPYLAYHPGGQEILEKYLGRDATILFDKYHSWVNIDGLVGPLLLGSLRVEDTDEKKRRRQHRQYEQNKDDNDEEEEEEADENDDDDENCR
ncbi:hypothetical protein ACHAXH_008683 [Discostella pseudostelligera]